MVMHKTCKQNPVPNQPLDYSFYSILGKTFAYHYGIVWGHTKLCEAHKNKSSTNVSPNSLLSEFAFEGVQGHIKHVRNPYKSNINLDTLLWGAPFEDVQATLNI